MAPRTPQWTSLLDALGEIADDDTWRKRRPRLDRVHLVTMATSAGQIAQRSAATPGRQTVPRALDLPAPPPILGLRRPRQPLTPAPAITSRGSTAPTGLLDVPAGRRQIRLLVYS